MIISRVDFTSFLADLENLSALQAQQKGLRFNLEPTLPLPHQVITDGTRLRQILWNLISNAVKFTQQGQVTVRVRYDEGDMLHFEVEDSGIGIPQDELDKIFAMYYQVKDSHGGKPATAPVLVWPFLVVWRKIWAAILRLPANRAKVQPLR